MRGRALAQFDLSVTDRRCVIGASMVGHAEAIPIVKHRTKLEKEQFDAVFLF